MPHMTRRAQRRGGCSSSMTTRWCGQDSRSRHRPSLPRDRLGIAQRSVPRLLYGGVFRSYRSFTHVQACGFARHPGRSYRSVATGQPWLVRPSLLRFVTSPHIGYAHRPNRAIDGVGTRTPRDSRPCRPLPPRPSHRNSLRLQRTSFCSACPGFAMPRQVAAKRWGRSQRGMVSSGPPSP